MLKRFMFALLFVALFLGLFFLQIRENEITVIKERIAAEEMANVKYQERLLDVFFVGHISDVMLIAELHALKSFALTENRVLLDSLKHDFLSFLSKKGDYAQIRFLDKNGFEKIRVDVVNGQPKLIAEEHLQDKSGRYYFVETRKLKPGQLYLSPLDLNVEHHKIERPFKPMLRVGVPIFDQKDEFRGALVVNYLAAAMLKVFKNAGRNSLGKSSLLNNEGFWLASENRNDEWGFMFPERRSANFNKHHPSAWKIISAARTGQLENADGIFSFSTINPKVSGREFQNGIDAESIIDTWDKSYPWKIVSFIPSIKVESILTSKLEIKEKRWLGFFLGLLMLFAAFLWFFLKSRQLDLEQQDKIRRLNEVLESKIEERTRQLRNSNKRLSTIIETTTQGFLMVDVETIIVEVNPALLTMLGRSCQELIGMPMIDLLDVEQRDFFRERISFRKQGISEVYDLNIVRPDGTVCHCHFQATPIVNEFDEIEGSFAFVNDLQEQLEFEQQLKDAKMEAEQNSAAKTLFLSSMSHEFRTPMNSILGFAQLLHEDDSLGFKQKDFIKKIMISGDHLKELINDILDFAKIESGVIEMNIENVDICQLIYEIIDMVTPEAQAREIELAPQEPETHYLVRVDPIRLQQILINLMNNAIKYCFVGGKIEIFCEEIEMMKLRFHISDNGPGIPEDKLDQLFAPFNRLGAETSTIQGAGLGLAISKNLAELMGCSLEVQQKSGPGCDFYIDLPLAEPCIKSDDAAKGTSAESTRAQNVSINACTLLYIEDDELNRILMEAIIAQRPYFKLLCSVNGMQGVEMAVKEQPDIILTDIGLPDIDGTKVLNELQKLPQTQAIPVVALSGNAAASDIENALAAGFIAYLTKPFNIGQLFATIDEIMEQINDRRE
jgi:PAS domain S-box-containing protein